VGAPSKVLELVQRFEDRRAEYIHPDYLEARARIDFINPFFEALGWDIANKAGLAEFEREVVTEDRIRVGGGLRHLTTYLGQGVGDSSLRRKDQQNS
jgi:hypothetical protein